MANDEMLLDSEQVDNLRELFGDGFNDLVQSYFKDFEEKEGELTVALKDKQISNIVKIAHALKGNSLNIGAAALAKICHDLEIAGKKGNIEEIMAEYDELQKKYPKTKEAFLHLSH